MTMQTDVYSTYLTTDGPVFAGRTRVRGFVCCGAASTAAVFEIRNGSTTGPILFRYKLPSNPNINSFSIQFPGEGILFSDGAYFTASTGSVTCISVFYA